MDFDQTQYAELLAENARKIFHKAVRSCDAQHGCLNYHRLWPLARLARSNGPKLVGSKFFGEQLAPLCKSKPARILIAGAADTGILAMLQQEIAANGGSANFVLADRCGTVIQQNIDYANLYDLQLECHQANLLELQCEPVQCIVGHSILAFIDPKDRLALLRKWHQLLQPAGSVLLSNLLHQQNSDVKFQPRSPMDGERLMLAAREHGFNSAEMAELESSLSDGWDFAELIYGSPSREVLLQEIEKAGFVVSQTHSHDYTEVQRGPVANGEYQNAQRVELCLNKLQA